MKFDALTALVLFLPYVLASPVGTPGGSHSHGPDPTFASHSGGSGVMSYAASPSSSDNGVPSSSGVNVAGSSAGSSPDGDTPVAAGSPSGNDDSDDDGQASSASTSPVQDDGGSGAWSASPPDVDDLRVLNYALTYEYLTTAFYENSLSRWSSQDFKAYGLDDSVYGRYQEIYEHRQEYVKFLESAITAAGLRYLDPCTYNFNYTTSVGDFVDHSEFFELTSTSMYEGALGMVSNKDYSSALGSILGVQARHSAWIQATVKGKNPWNTAFEAPLRVNQIWTTGDPFYVTCPPIGPGLPSLPAGLDQYPLFQIDTPQSIIPGDRVRIDMSEVVAINPDSIPNASSDKKLYVVYAIASKNYVEPLCAEDDEDADGYGYWVDVPSELASVGSVYVSIVQATPTEAREPGFQPNNDNSVAGPRVWMFDYDSQGRSDEGYELFKGSRTTPFAG
ncbi:hypothetical protein CC1G_01483 [Coprinopsis cinerea okayama7|uniref:Uncharacterized protein n=1 Tax=Coprinopsis cinerea (strain Okayama-7 / 130 / ATCC MYA-4618 / FGSC 9003) TaxID=240176 RepID=A8NHQ9_COPC7|nr:hypothetical protein CC1G_01483 [Coprinopsis cinerea okayama7\|eukprot:XP_001833806.1 hypothetical protein CC1G_01483 [Coprinopsis cinerea okayama7\